MTEGALTRLRGRSPALRPPALSARAFRHYRSIILRSMMAEIVAGRTGGHFCAFRRGACADCVPSAEIRRTMRRGDGRGVAGGVVK